ncbi:MAG: hypothetical protein DRH97_03235 [Chloroflexi bacterium]|nr:MAG: hypothetical protein DRH97_03235 [Chloroflexota bacterium]
MIDRRDISYTQGSPLTPISGGRLQDARWRGDSTPDIKSGELISRSPPSQRSIIKRTKIRLQSPIPLPIIGQFPYIDFLGTKPVNLGVIPIQDLFIAPPEDRIDIFPSPLIPIDPKIGKDVDPDLVKVMDDVLGETPGTPTPIVQPISLEIPKIDLGLPSWDDIKKPLLIAGIVAGVALFLPSIIGVFKK